MSNLFKRHYDYNNIGSSNGTHNTIYPEVPSKKQNAVHAIDCGLPYHYYPCPGGHTKLRRMQYMPLIAVCRTIITHVLGTHKVKKNAVHAIDCGLPYHYYPCPGDTQS